MSTKSPNPREAALEVLTAVREEEAFANLALPKALARSGLDQRDKGLVTELVYGSLRASGELDVVLRACISGRWDKVDAHVLDILRLGVYQVLHLRVPNHAAVDQSVRLAKGKGLFKAVGFINAVMRAVTAQEVSHWESVIAADTGGSVSHPTWIVSEIEQALSQCGGESELADALTAHNEPPRVTYVHLPGFSTPRDDEERTALSPLGSYAPAGNPGEDPRLVTGHLRVQDEGSQLAALLLSRASLLRAGERLLDMCAGPGGKTAVLAAEVLASGASVTAWEIQPHRAALVSQSVTAISNRNPESVSVSVVNAISPPLGNELFDRVLLDAPCSGLGALRRRPEARWRKKHSDLVGLVETQTQLLNSAVTLTKPGGIVAYVTCSPVTAETTDIVRAALAHHPNVEAMDTPLVLEEIVGRAVPGARRASGVQLWTHRHGTDAMFIQLLRVNETSPR